MMNFYFFVEGEWDQFFLEHVIEPLFGNNFVDYITYAQEPEDDVRSLVHSYYAMQAKGIAEVIYLVDSDFDRKERDILEIKEEMEQRHHISSDDIVVVIIEIESWYLAGLDDQTCDQLRIPRDPFTNSLGKQDFDRYCQFRDSKRRDTYTEIIQQYDLDIAQKKNNSFQYFVEQLYARYDQYLDSIG